MAVDNDGEVEREIEEQPAIDLRMRPDTNQPGQRLGWRVIVGIWQ